MNRATNCRRQLGLAAFGLQLITSILRGHLLDAIDHKQVNRALPGLELEAELFL
jgi:hypothetical protein